VNTVSNKVIRHSLAYLWFMGEVPTTWKLGWNWPTPFKNANFQSVFAQCTSAV